MDKALIDKVQAAFADHFGHPAERVFQAPGRVNLIGEHTDYNDGFVLPCAIDYATVVAVTPREDQRVCVAAADYEMQADEFSLAETIEQHPRQMWSNYVRGVIKHLQQRGLSLGGLNMVIGGNVPQGAGLSSSASLEVALGETFRQMFALPIDKQTVALNGQEAENQFVGCNCGIMDQMVSACGARHNALLLDCRSLDTRLIPMPDELAVMIINSNVKRGLVDSEYNTRREQCETAASVLGVKALRDVDESQLRRARENLDEVVFRRALHVVTENARTTEAADCLTQANYERLSVLMAESHRSMRDDFEITVPQIDCIVTLLSQYIGSAGGVRMTGGGFGGCVVALLPHDKVAGAMQLLEEHYHQQTGLNASVYVCEASEGAGEVVL